MADLPSPVAGLSFRPGATTDAAAVHGLLLAAYAVDEPEERQTPEEVQETYDTPWFDAVADTLVAVDEQGVVRAYGVVLDRPGQLRTRQATLDGVVDPALRGRGVGRAVLAWLLQRGREHVADAVGGARPVFLRVFAEDHLSDRAPLLRAAGLVPRRFHATMRRDLAAPLPAAALPAGLRLVTPGPGDDALREAARATHNAAFADHWGSEPIEADDWRRRVWASPGSRLDLSRLVLDAEDRVVGYLMSGTYPQDWEGLGFSEGWTDLLGVSEDVRGRGVGAALLVEALRAYAAEGLQRAGLGVDVDNPRALTLYRRLGWTEQARETSWVLDLGAGEATDAAAQAPR